MRLSFETWGERGGEGKPPPVLLLHSILENRRTWRNIGPEIARRTGRKVFAVDFRNHGLSPSSAEYCPRALTADVVDFLEHQDISQVALVGHSMGGMVAAMVAITKPSLVEKLVLEEAPPLGEDHSPSPAYLQAMKDIVANLLDSLPPDLDHGSALRSLVTTFAPLLPMLRIPPSFLETYDLLSLPVRWDGKSLSPDADLSAITRAVEEKGSFLVDISGRYEGEVLVLTGAWSHYARTTDSFVSKYFPRGRCMAFEGVGHFVHHVFPQEFIREVVCFLNAPPSSKL